MESIFLDTSIQIKRLIGPNRQRVAIERKLADTSVQAMTSHYVLMEFQRSLWSDYIRVYNEVLRHDSWQATVQTLRSGVLAYRPRSLGRCLQILTEVMVVSRLERDFGLDLLKTQIMRDLPKRFWRHVTPLPDKIVCDLVRIGVTRQSDLTYTVRDTCRKEMATCQLPNFLAAHQPQLRAISDYLAAHPRLIKNQPRVERLLAAVLSNPRAALGQSACWPLGDIIIALQVPSDAALWTLDPDFEPLTTPLGLNLYTPPSD